jgi:tRNA dimethylallyltransferase
VIKPSYNCLVVLGPTASGKTHLACQIAYHLKGEIISADSRQVYKDLDIGTGKDLDEYKVKNKKIKYHLIDVNEPDEQFYLHDFIRLLKQNFDEITAREHLPIICGGTGLYLEALEKDHHMTLVPENHALRNKLQKATHTELVKLIYNTKGPNLKLIDPHSKKRIIRGLEILDYLKDNPPPEKRELSYKPKYIGIKIDKDERNKRIDKRLKQRLENGLIEEVEGLLKKGITHERLQFLGLEYKFISYYLLKQMDKKELYTKLSTAIHQFAKRQMTWYRRMEKQGVKIEWVDLDEADDLIKRLKKEMQ